MSINTIETRDSVLRQYIDSTGGLPPDVLLGRIVMYTISDEAVAHEDLKAWFAELGLNPKLMPEPIKEVDAFRKATSSIDGNKYELSGEQVAHMLCRDVAKTPDFVRRQVTREIQNSKKKRLYYDAAVTATFYRKLNTIGAGRLVMKINPDVLLAEEINPMRAVTAKIEAEFRRYANFHDGQKLRGMVRAYVRHLHAIEIKGGVYFVHASRDAELAALCELVNRFGGTCRMKTLPIIDLLEEREYFAAIFEREASEDLQGITRDVKAAIAGGTMTGVGYARLKARFDEVMAKAEEHMVNLEVTQDLTAASAEVALNALTRLQEKLIA